MNLIGILLILLSNIGIAKKFKIHRCLSLTGSVIFQEDPCDLTHTNRKSTQVNKISSKLVFNPTIKLPVYQSRIVSKNSQSATKLISNQVKGYQVLLQVKQNWTIINKVYNNKLLHLEMVENSHQDQMKILVDFIFTDEKSFSKTELIELVHLSGSRFVKESKEGQINAYSLEINNGKGVVTTLTHSKVGFRDKIISKGAIYKNGWLVQFTYNGEDLHSHTRQFVLQSLFKNMQINKI